jgi:hypothetical protein
MSLRWSLLACLIAAPALGADVVDLSMGRIHGQVVDAASGQPLADAEVSAGNVTVRSDARGAFELLLAPGSWTVMAQAAEHLPYEQALVVAPGDDHRIDGR